MSAARAHPARLLALIGPGVLVAATGVGAGDLATAGFAGAQLGVGVAWAVLLGAGMKLAITEALARYQIATRLTALEGAARTLGRPLLVIFLLYLLPWTFLTASALMNASGVAAHSLLPLTPDPVRGKQLWGAALSLAGLGLVRFGGFRLFERAMSVAIGLMFMTTLATAVLLGPELPQLARGLLVPTIPGPPGEGLLWTVALIGGVGGTVTILCYSYWMREAGRERPEHLPAARLDAAIGYGLTALFGVAMLSIASGARIGDARGTGLLLELGEQLSVAAGPAGRTAFLLGAFAAIYSSLLGCWQAIPYLYADVCRLLRAQRREIPPPLDLAPGPVYRVSMVLIATVPMAGLAMSFRQAQQAYAVMGALFVPGLAAVLLVLTTRGETMGRLRTRISGGAALALTIAFFILFAALRARDALGL